MGRQKSPKPDPEETPKTPENETPGEVPASAPGPPKPDAKPESTAPTGKKAQATIVAQRIEEVLRIRLDGAEFHDVVQYSSEQKWNVGERQLWKYISRADELIVERQVKGRKKLLARHFTQRRSLYARALNAADYRTCLAVLSDEAKLRGLYPDTKEVKDLVKLAQSLGMKVEELERRLANAARTAESESQPNVPETGTPGPDHPGPAGGPPGSVPG
jgi:hypothetical protein